MEIKKAIDKIFNVIDAIKRATSEDSAKGKKITLAEGVGLAISGIGLVPAITAFSLLAEDWESRDPAKKAEWLQAFNERFDLKNDELESQIESLVGAILSLEGSFSALGKK
jgi:hypothetical protein